jgi:dUTPase
MEEGVGFTLTINSAVEPWRLSQHSSVFTLASAECVEIPARTATLICIGIRFKIPRGIVGIITSCSSDRFHNENLQVFSMTLDTTTSTTLSVRVMNIGDQAAHIRTGYNLCNISFVRCIAENIQRI